MSVDWTQLPPELLGAISKKLTVYADYLRFRAACRRWRTSAPPTPRHLPPQLPWLMLPHDHNHPSLRSFFSLSDDKFLSVPLPEPSPLHRRCGSSHGWLPLLHDSPDVLLLNPLTRAKAPLPPLTSFPNVVAFHYAHVGREYALRNSFGDLYSRSLRQMRDSFVKKMVLSSSPLEAGCVALAMLSQTGDLAFCRNGDRCWTFIDKAHSYCEDVVYHQGLFYAVDRYAAVAVCDVLSAEAPKVVILDIQRQFKGDMHYLVSCGDKLLLVTRYVDLERDADPDQLNLVYRTMMFEVYRLDWGVPRWERVRSLAGRAVFIGENSSVSLLASDFPGCQGDCIYYTDDYSESNYDGVYGEHDVGIFKLCNESIEQLSCYPRNLHTRLRWPPPLWVSPNPC